jgi:hypothetical protein
MRATSDKLREKFDDLFHVPSFNRELFPTIKIRTLASEDRFLADNLIHPLSGKPVAWIGQPLDYLLLKTLIDSGIRKVSYYCLPLDYDRSNKLRYFTVCLIV